MGSPTVPEHPQRREVVTSRLVGTPLHEGADRRRCRVELGHPVPLDDVPQPILRPRGLIAGTQLCSRSVGGALVDDTRAAVGQRPVDDVAVTGHPPDVRSAPVHVGVRLQVEDVLVRERDLGEIAPGRVHDALGLGSGPRGVEQVQQVLGVHLLGRAVGGRAGDEVVVPVVPTVDHLDIGVASVDDDDGLHRRGLAHRSVDIGFQRRGCTPPITSVGSDDDVRLGVVDSIDDRVGREATEDDRVGRADPRAGQHGDGQLGDHRHVDGDAVALLDPEALQGVREPAHLVEQILVGDRAGVAGLTFPVERDLVASASLDMAIEAVVAHVELAADEPLGEGQVPFEDGVEVLVPAHQLPGLACPEGLVVGFGLLVQRPVGRERGSRELATRWKGAFLDVVVLDRGISSRVGHRRSLPLRRPCTGGEPTQQPVGRPCCAAQTLWRSSG